MIACNLGLSRVGMKWSPLCHHTSCCFFSQNLSPSLILFIHTDFFLKYRFSRSGVQILPYILVACLNNISKHWGTPVFCIHRLHNWENKYCLLQFHIWFNWFQLDFLTLHTFLWRPAFETWWICVLLRIEAKKL